MMTTIPDSVTSLAVYAGDGSVPAVITVPSGSATEMNDGAPAASETYDSRFAVVMDSPAA